MKRNMRKSTLTPREPLGHHPFVVLTHSCRLCPWFICTVASAVNIRNQFLVRRQCLTRVLRQNEQMRVTISICEIPRLIHLLFEQCANSIYESISTPHSHDIKNRSCTPNTTPNEKHMQPFQPCMQPLLVADLSWAVNHGTYLKIWFRSKQCTPDKCRSSTVNPAQVANRVRCRELYGVFK